MKRGDDMKARILDAGIVLARTGLHNVTMRGIAASLNSSHTVVRYHFGDQDQLRNAVIDRALMDADRRVIIRLIMDDHPKVKHFTKADRASYVTGA